MGHPKLKISSQGHHLYLSQGATNLITTPLLMTVIIYLAYFGNKLFSFSFNRSVISFGSLELGSKLKG